MYESAFHANRRRGIEAALARAAKTNGLTNETIELRRHIGNSVDALPPVRIDSLLSEASSSIEESAARRDELARAERRAACLGNGAFVSSRDDCRAYCDVEDGVEYRYVDSVESMLRDGKLAIKPGSYCLPTAAARCNLNTSILVYGKYDWRCLSQTRAFSGEGGNRIVVCDGRLLDRATGRV